MTRPTGIGRRLALVCATLLVSTAAQAQANSPDKPIRMIIAFAAGGDALHKDPIIKNSGAKPEWRQNSKLRRES